MTRFQSQIMYGVSICVTGIIIAILSYDPSRTIQYVLASGILLSAVLAFITAGKNKDAEVRLKFHGLQGLGMFAYALAVFVYGEDFETFITITMAFLLYFGITEIIFGFQLMQYKKKISMPVIAVRMITGLVMTVGAVMVLAFGSFDKNTSLLVAGILMALAGVNFVLFADYIRRSSIFV